MPVVFGVLYLLALTVFVVGTFGFFGQVRDPLSGVSLIPLGMPWNWMIDLLPEPLWPWLAAAAPSINLGILWMLCRLGLRSSADERTSF
ncbi:hypothetical protein G3480_17275 [Thiorhodococcus mannitoliphagus]|uniref:Uncharacterized protein n=2 Tax=Thiorhodococcus mannitoliphagus TaxID=329406 RepID=A0A6P1DZ73_9GAMM|nr:hypothetical protein [Thiorhodococcus mannitoliphagus]